MFALRLLGIGLVATTPTLAEREDGWSGSGDVGVTLASGNSESLRATAGLEVKRTIGPWEALAEGSAIYGEDDGVSSNERVDLSLQLNRDLSRRVYLGITDELLYDPLAGIDLRLGITPVLGWRVLDDERLKLRVEAGPGYIWENRNGDERGYGSVRLHEDLSIQVTKGTRIFQALTAEFEAEDLENYILTAEAGIESKLVGRWSLRVAGTAINYGQTLGKNDADLLVTLGFGYNYLPGDNDEDSLASAHGERQVDHNEWVITALLGGSYSEGNSDALSMNSGLEVRREGEKGEFAAGLFGSYSETNGLVSTETIAADAHYQRNVRKAWFVGLRTDFDHDAVADLDWRLALTPYLGRKLFKSKRSKLTVELGPSGVIEQQGGAQDSFLGAYAAVKAEHRLGESTRLFGDVSWLSESTEWSSYLLSSEMGIDQTLTEKLSLKFIARSTFDSTPARGRQRHDLQLVSALGVTF